MSYTAQILIPSAEDASIEALHEFFVDFYSDAEDVSVSSEETKITIQINDWKCTVAFNTSESVLVESREMAEFFAKDRPDQSEIAKSEARFEVATDADMEMDYFNDYVEIVEQLESYDNAKVFEPSQGKFTN